MTPFQFSFLYPNFPKIIHLIILSNTSKSLTLKWIRFIKKKCGAFYKKGLKSAIQMAKMGPNQNAEVHRF